MTLTLFSLQGFSSKETDFYFCQFLSNFFKYLISNFLSSYSYNIFAMYLSGNTLLLLKFFFLAISKFFYYITSIFILLSNLAITLFVFSKPSSLSQVLCFALNSFYHTEYLTTSCIFLLFKIFSTSHSSIFSTSTSISG